MSTLLLLISSLFLVIAVSIDAFGAAVAYGSRKITIPFRSAVTIAAVCSTIFGVALFAGAFVARFIPPAVLTGVAFALLFCLGLLHICDSALKNWIRKRANRGQIRFSLFHLQFILNVFADPHIADQDQSKTLSVKEAVVLSVALSLDGIAAGIGGGLSDQIPLVSIGLLFALTLSSMLFGARLGRRLARSLNADISWIGGGLLILIAVLQLVL